ncbi:ubiquitin fusion degradation protein 1, putative [Plasmodium vinckei brucechwatti]|uniref:Ubiquitin fusion degradation protein 1, putative n=1 Tax=Plasmodium vinckei brucechwatti TaxID=119398 RepID=A0A6V7SLT2_PLAVN|nr:ubiquitin fusion degradation protein 1, putative [Plasmodium vinckei brucechwatti]
MDDDFARALNKFNSNRLFNKHNIIKNVNKTTERSQNKKQSILNKLKEDLELEYIHSSNNKICQKFLTLCLRKSSGKLNDHSDKIILPVSILKTLEKGTYSNEVSFPYTFSLKNVQNNYMTHACVLEFSSSEGIIEVSENIKENLGIFEKNGVIRILVTYANLSKCDFIKFESLNENINDIKFMKNLLENQLSLNYSTLTLGDYVHINNLKFYISELEPDNAVSLINTDITVDICERTNISGNQINFFSNDIKNSNNNNPYEIINNTQVNITNIINSNFKKYKFIINYNILELLKKGNISINISLKSEDINKFNIFISFPPYDDVSETVHHLHFDDCSDQIKIDKEIIQKCLKYHFIYFQSERENEATQHATSIATTNDNNNLLCCDNYDGNNSPQKSSQDYSEILEYVYDQFFPHIIFLGISSNSNSPVEYNLSTNIIENALSSIKDKDIENQAIKKSANNNMIHNQNYIKCDNCLKDILEYNINMHKIHCLKNFSICNICKQSFKKNELINHIHCDLCNEGMHINDKNKHNLIWHVKIKCLCEKSFYRKQFIFHQKLFCSKKIIFCPFCNIFTAHFTNIYDEDFIIANFFDQLDNKQVNNIYPNNNGQINPNFETKSISYYVNLLHNNFTYFLKYIKNSEHEKYCGSKSVSCIICKKNMYRNLYLTHLISFHNFTKIDAFKIINENIQIQ